MAYLHMCVPDRFHRDLQAEATRHDMSLSEYVRAALSYTMRRGERAHMFREITFAPKSDTSIDQVFEWLAARQPTLADISGGEGGAIAPAVASAMRMCLEPHEMVRVEQVVVRGRTLEEVGQEHGVSKQAVHATVRRAGAKLVADDRFIAALCAQFPDSGLTPALLRRAAEVRRA